MAGRMKRNGGQGLWCEWCECDLTIDVRFCGPRCEAKAAEKAARPQLWCVLSLAATRLGMVAGRKIKTNGEPTGSYGWVTTADCVLLFQSEQAARDWALAHIGHPFEKGWDVCRFGETALETLPPF